MAWEKEGQNHPDRREGDRRRRTLVQERAGEEDAQHTTSSRPASGYVSLGARNAAFLPKSQTIPPTSPPSAASISTSKQSPVSAQRCQIVSDRRFRHHVQLYSGKKRQSGPEQIIFPTLTAPLSSASSHAATSGGLHPSTGKREREHGHARPGQEPRGHRQTASSRRTYEQKPILIIISPPAPSTRPSAAAVACVLPRSRPLRTGT